MNILKKTTLIIGLMFLCACGYGFPDGSTASLPEEYRTLAIASVEQPSLYSWVEPRIRSLLRDELNRRKWVTWADKSKASAWIKINVSKFSNRASVSGDEDETLRSSASITMEAVIVSAVDGHTLWSSGTISEDWPYYGNEVDEANDMVTELAIRKLADRLSQNY